MKPLQDKIIILSYASSPYAEPLTRVLVDKGATVVVVDPILEQSQALCDTLANDQVHALSAEVDIESVRSALQTIHTQYGVIDFLITCPPKAPTPSPTLNLPDERFRIVWEETVLHAFIWSKVAGEVFVERQTGSIVHLMHPSGMGGWRQWLATSSAFGALHNLIHTLAAEWAPIGVRINGLVPGITAETAEQILAAEPHLSLETITQRIPKNRFTDAHDIANGILYLIDPASSYVSGEILRVDGGWDIWGQLYAVAKE